MITLLDPPVALRQGLELLPLWKEVYVSRPFPSLRFSPSPERVASPTRKILLGLQQQLDALMNLSRFVSAC